MAEHQNTGMENAPQISVIIPVYNSEQYLEKCLDSVLASSFSDLEIICVDDGSTDRSMEILQSYSMTDQRVKILTQEHLFAGAARNTGIKAAAGKYIHFLDSDDMIVPDAYEKLYAAAEASQAEVCECLYVYTDVSSGEIAYRSNYRRQNSRFPLSVHSCRTNARSLIFGHVVPWNKIYQREFLLQNNILFDDLICAEDRSFYFEVILKTKRIIRIPDRLMIHRVNIPTSLDGSDIRFRHFEVEFRSFERIWEMVKDEPDRIKKTVLENCIHDSMFYYRRAVGTEYEEPIRDLLTDYWRPYIPILGTEVRLKWWYMLYVGLLTKDKPGRFGSFIRNMIDRFNEANNLGGWRYSLVAKAIRAFFVLIPTPDPTDQVIRDASVFRTPPPMEEGNDNASEKI